MIRLYLADGTLFEFNNLTEIKAWMDVFPTLCNIERLEDEHARALEIPRIEEP